MLVGKRSQHYNDSTLRDRYFRCNFYTARIVALVLLTSSVLITWHLHNWGLGRHRQSGWRFSATSGSEVYPDTPNSRLTSKPDRIVVMPVDAVSANFCRTLFALLINGYPTPIIIGWNVKMQHRYYDLKVETLNKWIHNGQGNDSDIILVIDARDVYAQLSADTFFNQFEEQHSAPDIIVGAEKNCWPGPRTVARCAMLPESPLPTDVYGDLTDRDQTHHPSNFTPGPMPGDPSTWEYGRLETWRPRYINSGTIVGRRGDLKRLSDDMTMHARLALSGATSIQRKGDDQELLGIANLGQILLTGIGLVIPDMLTKFFQVVTFAYKDLEIHSLGDILRNVSNIQQASLHKTLAENEEWRHRSVIWNRISRTVPSFLHFPGTKLPAKTEPYYTNLWFMKADSGMSGKQGTDLQRPADKFLKHLQAHTDEHYGYGVRLDDGKWMGFADMCSSYTSRILATDDSWIKHPGRPKSEYGQA